MKNISLVFSSLALIGVFVLLGMKFTEKKPTKPTVTIRDSSGKEVTMQGGRIAYVNIDTLEANYNYFKQKKVEFESRQKSIDAELEKNANGLQNEYEALRKQAQSGTLSQSEGEAAQQKLIQRQQDLELKRQNLSQKFLKDREDFNKEIHDDLNEYIKEYNEEKGYDYIFTYTEDGMILFANKEHDITADIIAGMNSQNKKVKDSKATAEGTTK